MNVDFNMHPEDTKHWEDNQKDFKLIESNKRIFYFSKFSLDIEQCLKVILFTKQIKENVLRSILEPLKYFMKSKLTLF